MTLVRRVSAVCAVSALLASAAYPAVASAGSCYPPPPEKSKCNSGNGNGSESLVNTVHCTNGDPGNSFTNNKGGDEIPTSGGIPNPGGNNTPG